MRRWRRALAGLLLAGLAFPLSAGAAERDTAYAAYQTGHYRRALSEALKRIEADSKDAAAMTLVGEIYRQGLGVRPDQRVATEWYERAAERGDINAAYALAIALLDTTFADPAAEPIAGCGAQETPPRPPSPPSA
ncbi:MAG: hypothetical protein Q8S58_13260 [Bosea sp. (in: a-proteobacteria)]|nr:hypothetical protein [Bosea sp. (in: a-proteobacteria)]